MNEKFNGVFPAFYACYDEQGNVDEKKSKELVKEIILDNKISNVKFETDYNVYVKNISNSVEVVRENSEFSTSSVCCNYKVRDMCCYRDRVLLTIVKIYLVIIIRMFYLII